MVKLLHGNQKDCLMKKLDFLPDFQSLQPPILAYDNARTKAKFNGDFLKQEKVTYNHGPVVNIYAVYRLAPTTKDSSVTLHICLFNAVKLTKKC